MQSRLNYATVQWLKSPTARKFNTVIRGYNNFGLGTHRVENQFQLHNQLKRHMVIGKVILLNSWCSSEAWKWFSCKLMSTYRFLSRFTGATPVTINSVLDTQQHQFPHKFHCSSVKTPGPKSKKRKLKNYDNIIRLNVNLKTRLFLLNNQPKTDLKDNVKWYGGSINTLKISETDSKPFTHAPLRVPLPFSL